MVRLVIIISIVAFLSSCSKKITTTNTSTKDSTSVREKIKYVPILIPGEKVQLPGIVIKCDSITNKPIPVKIKGKNGRASVEAEINKDAVLNVEGSCDSLTQVIQTMDREIFRLKHEQKDTTIVKQPSKFMIWINWTAYGLSIIFILYIVFRVIKIIYL